MLSVKEETTQGAFNYASVPKHGLSHLLGAFQRETRIDMDRHRSHFLLVRHSARDKDRHFCVDLHLLLESSLYLHAIMRLQRLGYIEVGGEVSNDTVLHKNMLHKNMCEKSERVCTRK